MIESFVYNFQTFMMIFARIMGLFSLAPVYSSEAISFQVRVMLAFLLSLILFPVTANYLHKVPPGMGEYALIILSEALTGFFQTNKRHFQVESDVPLQLEKSKYPLDFLMY